MILFLLLVSTAPVPRLPPARPVPPGNVLHTGDVR